MGLFLVCSSRSSSKKDSLTKPSGLKSSRQLLLVVFQWFGFILGMQCRAAEYSSSRILDCWPRQAWSSLRAGLCVH